MNSKLYKRMTAWLIILCLLLPVLSFAGEEDGTAFTPFINGRLATDKVLKSAPKSAVSPLRRDGELPELPEKYRSDEQVWAQGIKVKNQDKAGLCWAISITTTSEYSYAKELYDLTGEAGAVPEFSPGHLAQFYYNRVPASIGDTSGDRNATPYDHWSLQGGNELYAIQYFASLSGLGAEKNTPYSEVNDRIIYKNGKYLWNGENVTVYDDSYAYNNAATFEECAYVMNPGAGYLKYMVYYYGAVSAGIWFDTNKYMNLSEKDPEDPEKTFERGRSYYCYETPSTTNHSVSIIGWDDSYPKERFAHKIAGMSDEAAYALTTPEHDGALIVQNSWGSSKHDRGFFYMSYESKDINRPSSDFYVYDLQPANTYTSVFMYDGTAGAGDTTDTGDGKYLTASGASAANIFTNTTTESLRLEALSYVTYTPYRVENPVKIFKNPKDPCDPESGELVCSQTVTSYCAGSKTRKLETPVTVEPGETFSVVFYFNDDNAFGVEAKGSPLFLAETNPGQSFFRGAEEGDAWVDMNDYNACFRIKAFANPVNTEVFGHKNADGTVKAAVKSAPESSLLLAARKENGKLTGARVLPVTDEFNDEFYPPGEGGDITLTLLDDETYTPICKAKKIASQ
ncbi:MAG: hypothetical protein IJS65_08055 [Clostridia bacterium]|nr:hypothetical protein [Clostridia bacterium]